MKEESKNIVENIPSIADFAIITTEVEFEAVKDILGLKDFIRKEGRTYFYGQVVSSDGGGNHFVVCSKCRSRSNLPANSLTQDVVKHWKPDFTLVVGIAGGVEGRENINLGDVVVHNHLEYYEFIKEIGGQKKKRILELEVSSPLILDIVDIINYRNVRWWEEIKAPIPEQKIVNPKVLSGEILCGDKLLGCPDSVLLKELLDLHDKAVAVEMESGGVARALYEAKVQHMTHFLVIRGVSDYCNRLENQQMRDTWKEYAMQAAASLALAIIKNTPKKNRVQSMYEQYRSSFKKKLQTAFPKPQVEFKLTFKSKSAPDERMPIESLREKTMDEKRVILRGPAGSSKTITLGKLAGHLLEIDNIIPLFLNLRDWRKEYSEELSKLESTSQTFNLRLDILLRVSIVDLNLIMLNDFPANSLKFILLDGLNEVYGENIIRQIIDTLDEYIRLKAPNTYGLMADRLALRDFLPRWRKYMLNPLDSEEVRREIGEETYAHLSQADKNLLESPYFLDQALKSNSPRLGSKAKAIQSFFIDQMGFNKVPLDCLAKSAFNMYNEYHSPSFNAEKFKQEIGIDTWKKLLYAGVVKKPVNGYTQFDHQLKHDYLSSRYLAQNKEIWGMNSFDTVSFQSSSFEPLLMALEQLPDTLQGDEFVRSVYDWNWVAAITCVAKAVRNENRFCTQEMAITVLAIISEKLFDPMYWTRRRVRKILNMFPSEIADKFENTKNLKNLVTLVKDINYERKKRWFLKWKKLFSLLPEAPFGEKEIIIITERNSILGWTASNVIKRFNLNDADLRQLRTIYNSHDENTPRDTTIRWRVVHALGAFDIKENVKLLFFALDNDSYHWTRYGAARSLVEIAAKTENDNLCRDVIVKLKQRIEILPPKVMEEVGRAVFYKEAQASWYDQVIPLLEKVRDSQKTGSNRERWNKTMKKFERFFREGENNL